LGGISQILGLDGGSANKGFTPTPPIVDALDEGVRVLGSGSWSLQGFKRILLGGENPNFEQGRLHLSLIKMFATRFQRVVTAGVALSTGLPCLGADLEGYDLDKLFSFSWGEFRVRPQFATSFTFNDNIFYAPSEGLSFIDPSTPAHILKEDPTGPGFRFNPEPNSALQPYTGVVQHRVYSNDSLTNLVAASPLFLADVYPPLQVPFTPDQTARFFGFRTNSLQFSKRTSDVIGSVSPGMELQYGSEEYNFVGGSYNVDIVRYIDQGIEPDPMHRFKFQQRVERSRLRFDGSQSLAYMSSFLGAGANQGGRLVDRWNGLMLGRVTYDSSAKTDVYSELSYNFTEYKSNIPLYSDNTWQVAIGSTYKPTERFFFFAEGHYSQTVSTPAVSTLAPAPYSQVYGGFFGIRGNFTEKIQGSIRGGYEIREFPSVTTSDPFGIPAAEISLTYLPRYSTQVTISYSRRTAVAAQIAQQAASYDAVVFGARQVIGTSAKWIASAEVRMSLGEFDSLVTPQAVVYDHIPGSNLRYPVVRSADFQRSENTMNYNVGLSYSPRPWLSAQLGYEYESYLNKFADAGFEDYFLPDYDAHRVTLTLQLGY
jgi:hypothetical protein